MTENTQKLVNDFNEKHGANILISIEKATGIDLITRERAEQI